MQKKKLKVFIIILTIVVVIIISFFILLNTFFLGFCSNLIIDSQSSPNNDFKAIVFVRDCGATTSSSLQVSILRKNKELKNSAGNIFVCTNSDFVKVNWKNDKKLLVTHNSKDIFLKESKFKNIEIVFKKIEKKD